MGQDSKLVNRARVSSRNSPPARETSTGTSGAILPPGESFSNHRVLPPGRTQGACPGYVVDHVIPFKRGGPDSPDNMQWQSKEEGAAKDRVE